MKLMDIVVKDAIIPELQSTNRDGTIAELVDSLVAANCVTEDRLHCVEVIFGLIFWA